MPITSHRKPHGIKEIADALGVSIGTVDRALHNRKGVNAKTRDKVLKMANELCYSPNIAARNLKLSRQLKIGVYLPGQIASYWNNLREGIRFAARTETSVSIELHFLEYPMIAVGDIELMHATNWLQFDGVIIAPGYPARMMEISKAAMEKGKPIVCVTTDVARLQRLALITADSVISGSVAAELLSSWIYQPGKAAIFTGDILVQDHGDKVRGFAATLATNAPHLMLLPVIESHDSSEHAYQSAKKVLAENRDLRGIYVNTSNCLPVLKAVEEQGRIGTIVVIATDLFPEMIPLLESGAIRASLYQRPYTQGRLALEALSGFLARGIRPRQTTRLAPHIILRSNLSLFTRELASPDIETGEG